MGEYRSAERDERERMGELLGVELRRVGMGGGAEKTSMPGRAGSKHIGFGAVTWVVEKFPNGRAFFSPLSKIATGGMLL